VKNYENWLLLKL